MKRISLEQLLKEYGAFCGPGENAEYTASCSLQSYAEQYRAVCDLIKRQRIKPVKNSPLNGKTPALHQSYWLMEEAGDYGKEAEELKFHMVPAIRTDYYLAHPAVYQEEKKWVKLLNRYLMKEGQIKPEPVSLNERSFQIWGREKFLQKEQGKKILAHCGLSLEQLSVYHTTEPLAYYSHSRRIPQTVLILENKDTFYSMRKSLLKGLDIIFGEEIGTIVYGAGKGILRSFEDFRFCVEPHINDAGNKILYFGDLDYEGIGIYERLEALFCSEHEIRPFVGAYEKSLRKAEQFGIDFLPETSEKQNQNISGQFFRYFTDETKEKMKQILCKGKYIPQEIMNIADFDEKK